MAGGITGSIDAVDSLARHHALQARRLVLSVEYRLAREHPWPTANEGAYAALLWAAQQGAEIGVDATGAVDGGVSSGANIPAVVALMARDRAGPALRLRLIEMPSTDLTMGQPSMTRYASGYICARARLLDGYGRYSTDPSRRGDPYAWPLFAELAGPSPAVVSPAATTRCTRTGRPMSVPGGLPMCPSSTSRHGGSCTVGTAFRSCDRPVDRWPRRRPTLTTPCTPEFASL
jgi:acetyl esterase